MDVLSYISCTYPLPLLFKGRVGEGLRLKKGSYLFVSRIILLEFLFPVPVNQLIKPSPVITEIFKVNIRRYKMITKRYIAPCFQNLIYRQKNFINALLPFNNFRFRDPSHHLKLRILPAYFYYIHPAMSLKRIHAR